MAENRKRLTPRDVERVEKETLELVVKTLPKIETAIASWDSLKHKPPELRRKFEEYRRLHGQLSDWARKALISASKAESEEARANRMWDYVALCRALRKVG
ncbi:MAG: hypothetical protein AB1324_01335 [Candidatus Micrarchaeota archaeon]